MVKVHIVLQERRVAITKKKPSPFLKKFLRQSEHPNLNQKRQSYSIYGIIVSTPHWLIQLTTTSFTFLFSTLSVYIKAT